MFRFISYLEDINRKELKRATQTEPLKPSFLVRLLHLLFCFICNLCVITLYITLFTSCSRI